MKHRRANKKYVKCLSTPLWHAVFDMSQKVPFPAMPIEVVRKEGCRMYYDMAIRDQVGGDGRG